MWHLEFLSPVQEGAYIAMFLEQMKINRDNISIKSVKKYLTDDLLRKILISHPLELYGMCEDLKSHLFPSILRRVMFARFVGLTRNSQSFYEVHLLHRFQPKHQNEAYPPSTGFSSAQLEPCS